MCNLSGTVVGVRVRRAAAQQQVLRQALTLPSGAPFAAIPSVAPPSPHSHAVHPHNSWPTEPLPRSKHGVSPRPGGPQPPGKHRGLDERAQGAWQGGLANSARQQAPNCTAVALHACILLCVACSRRLAATQPSRQDGRPPTAPRRLNAWRPLSTARRRTALTCRWPSPRPVGEGGWSRWWAQHAQLESVGVTF